MSGENLQNKDAWDKLHIVLAPVGGLLTAIAVASLGFFGSRAIEQQQNRDAMLRLLSELMTRREESEATLRKEMFQSIIGSFFEQGAIGFDEKILKLELLAQNFHEALSLKPLFLHLRREIRSAKIPEATRRFHEDRLIALAREVARKQLVVLEPAGRIYEWTVAFSDSLLEGSTSEQLEDVQLGLNGMHRRFRLTVLKVDTGDRQLRTQLDVETRGADSTIIDRTTSEFELGFYASPMIDNTRLSHDQRVSIVLSDLNEAGASLTLIYFPGSRASLRDRPYFEDLVRVLESYLE